MSTSRLFAAAVSAALLLGGCANSSALQYTTSQAQNTARVYYGEVLSVTPTTIRGEDNALLTTAGSLLGGIGGSNFGKGRGEAVSAILGAVVGGLGAQSLTSKARAMRFPWCRKTTSNSSPASAYACCKAPTASPVCCRRGNTQLTNDCLAGAAAPAGCIIGNKKAT